MSITSALATLAQQNKTAQSSGVTTNKTRTAQTDSSSGSSSSSSALSSADQLSSTFLQLLIAEIQTQDPTSPMDPTTMVNQLVELNSLASLQSIQTNVDDLTNALGVSSSSSS